MTANIPSTTSAAIARFADRTALVTGGGTGMGRAGAIALARGGARVVIAGRRREPLEAVVAEIEQFGGVALAVPTDVSDAEQVKALVDRTVATFGALHLAWNNAGLLGEFGPAQDLELDIFDALVATNLRGIFACLQHEVRAMLAQGTPGAIVNTSSWTAHGAMPGVAAYAATKAALEALNRTMAVELGPKGIRINNVSPGIIATPMAGGVLASDTARQPFVRQTPLERIGTAAEVADAVAWLLSDEARFVTGQSLLVDGGFTLGGMRPWMHG